MAGLPVVLPIPQETASASYSFTDIASGTGYVVYDAYQTKIELTDPEFHLSPNALSTAVQTIETTDANPVTFAFDTTTFNSPRVIKGEIVANLCAMLSVNTSTSFEITIQFFHFDGSTETSMAAAVKTDSIAASSGVKAGLRVIKFDVGLTNFKKGDLLRMKITLDSTQTGEFAVGTDPNNRDVELANGTIASAVTPTWFKVAVPFRIDI
jgi:hypothetical protein